MRLRRTITSGADSASGDAIKDLVERIGAYTACEPLEAPPTEMSEPAEPAGVSAETVEAVAAVEAVETAETVAALELTFREYQHPVSPSARVVPLSGALDDATLRLLHHVVAHRDDDARRVVVLEIAVGAVATRQAMHALSHAHVVAHEAGNWIVMVSPEQTVRDAISNLGIPGGPIVAATNARAMEYALAVVEESAGQRPVAAAA